MELQKLRKSASLIVFRESPHTNTLEYLLMTRKTTMSFANACVFPGGVCDPGDKHHNKEQFIEYGKVTAIRETFEETGLLVLPEGFDIGKLDYKSGESTHDLVNKCWDSKTLREILPVIRLMTVQMKGKRYDTWFYVASPRTKMINYRQYLKNKDEKVLGNLNDLITDDESLAYRWGSATGLLEAACKGEIILYPPQLIILGSLKNYNSRKILTEVMSKINDFQPILFALDRKAGQAILPQDHRYEHQKILDREPESQSKQELVQYFSKLKGTKHTWKMMLNFQGPYDIECTTGKPNLITLGFDPSLNPPKPKL